MLDRVDIQLSVPRLTRVELLGSDPGEASPLIRARVEAARDRQRARMGRSPWRCNAQMPGAMARREARLTEAAERLLSGAVETLMLSGRSFDRALKVARTIADLAGRDRVERGDVAEALSYRAGSRSEEVARVG
jgi:magnesium chelatase family protein